MTSSSADHWALAVYSRKIRPATAQLKSPGKLTAWVERERERSGVKVTDVNGRGNQKKLRNMYNYLLVCAPPFKFLQGQTTKIHHHKAFVKEHEMTEERKTKAGNQR